MERRRWCVLACSLVVAACSDETDSTAPSIAVDPEPICVLAELAANALVEWRGGNLPQGLDNVCEGLLRQWAGSVTVLDLKVRIEGGATVDYQLPPLPPVSGPPVVSPEVQAALDRLEASIAEAGG